MRDALEYLTDYVDEFFMGKTLCISIFSLGLLACSLDASIESLSRLPSEPMILNRTSPDLLHGEVVTTSSGFRMVGLFGELSEKTESLTGNHWHIEGAFYE